MITVAAWMIRFSVRKEIRTEIRKSSIEYLPRIFFGSKFPCIHILLRHRIVEMDSNFSIPLKFIGHDSIHCFDFKISSVFP